MSIAGTLVTDEKIPSYYFVPGYVHGCVRQFYDVEGAER